MIELEGINQNFKVIAKTVESFFDKGTIYDNAVKLFGSMLKEINVRRRNHYKSYILVQDRLDSLDACFEGLKVSPLLTTVALG